MNSICATRRDRGSFMLSFAGLTAVLAILCAIALLRSLESYRASALAVQKLQARAAAEGAMVAWSHGTLQAGEELQLGECRARIESEPGSSSPILVPVVVEVHPNESKSAVLHAHYTAMADDGTSGAHVIRSLELVR
jgi:hypothetical protein